MRFGRVLDHRRVAAAVVVATMVATALVAPPNSGALPLRAGRPAQEDPHGQDGVDTSLKGEYDEVIGQESELVEQYQAAQLQRVELTSELTRMKADLKRTQFELLQAHVALDAALAAEKRQVAARKAADARVTAAEKRLRDQIVASYVRGGQDTSVLEALLNAENGEEAGQALAFSRVAVHDSNTLKHDLEKARADRRKAEHAAKVARAKARTKRDDIDRATKFISAAADNQSKLVDDINRQVLAEQVALREVQSRKAIIEGRINTINRSSDGVQLILAGLQAGQPDWVPGDVDITNPIPGYEIGSKFGPRFHPILHVSRLHAGGDMGAPSGTTIYAPADGIVVIAGVRGGYGNTTVIDHGHSLGTLYGHQSQLLVKPGQAVKRGDPIGKVGSTGLSTGPHLHFETRIKGVPIDPEGVVDFTRPQGSYEEEAKKLAEAFGGN